MTELQPDPRLAPLLARYQELGGVVEHVLIRADEPGLPEPESHRRAALGTLRALAHRTDAYFDRLLSQPGYRNRSRDEFFRVTIRDELLTGRPIPVDEFVGPWFDPRTKCFARTTEPTGYAYAFLDPPYPLCSAMDEALALFLAICDELFRGFREPLTIYSWSDECSNYFDAGRDWWGTFFWTVEVAGSGIIIGIAASTTD